jgi:LPS export ABC transporter protein LptC
MQNKSSFIIPIIVILIAATYIYLLSSPQKKVISGNFPKSWSKNISINDFDPQGQLKTNIIADKMVTIGATKKQVAHDIWTNPKIRNTDYAGMVWNIHAKHGISYEQNKIVLTNNVYMHRLPNIAHPDKADTVITTEEITMYPKKSIATTDKFATIVQPQQTVSGYGMIINFKTSRAKILKDNKFIFHNFGD